MKRKRRAERETADSYQTVSDQFPYDPQNETEETQVDKKTQGHRVERLWTEMSGQG